MTTGPIEGLVRLAGGLAIGAVLAMIFYGLWRMNSHFGIKFDKRIAQLSR
jgi:hypothetical protein